MSCERRFVVKARPPAVNKVCVQPPPPRACIRATERVGPSGRDAVGSTLTRELLSGTPDGGATVFAASQEIAANTEIVSINGVTQRPELHYTVDGANVVFDDPPEPGDVLMISYSAGG